MARRSDNSRRLARAGWSVISLSPEPEKNPGLSPDLEAEGERLVSEVASSWTRKYLFTIVKLGFDRQSAFHYECLFSLPTNEQPVPTIVLSTRFALVVPSVGVDPRLFYSFEEGDLRHEWALVRDSSGRFRAAQGQQFTSLGDDLFEQYIDRVIAEKDRVRERGIDLKTAFEETRLREPSVLSAPGVNTSSYDADSDEELGIEQNAPQDVHIIRPDTEPGMREGLVAAGLYCEKVEPPSTLADLLANIFDAADEGDDRTGVVPAGKLPHHEVAKLLSATLPGFGLELWDIHLLLTSTPENDDGFIECKPFIQSAPEIIQSLQKRRMTFRSRGLPGVEIPHEAVTHCFSDEVQIATMQLLKVFEQCATDTPAVAKFRVENHHGHGHSGFGRRGSKVGMTGRASMLQGEGGGIVITSSDGEEKTLVSIKRRFCQDCLTSMPERLSPQESMRLMQMLPEDEDGYLQVDEVHHHLEHLRTEAMLNALVESDVESLRKHLVICFRHVGLQQDGRMKLWMIKQALLQADQICLTRMQIHLLLCLAEPDTSGFVDIGDFLAMCCVVIPHMFDAKKFVDSAEQLILEHAEAVRHAENAELEALGGRAQLGQDGEESQEKTEVDQETVERTLQQMLQTNATFSNAKNAQGLENPDTIWNILKSNEKEVQTNCQLSDFELYGFCAEMATDAEGQCLYVDHIKKWVPIIFEMRKNRLLHRYMEEGSAENLGIETPDKEKLEAMFPLLPRETAQHLVTRSSRRRSTDHGLSGQHSSRRMGSKENSGRFSSKELDEHGHPVHRHPTRMLSKRVSVAGDLGIKTKEPPAGRGYARRKQRMEEARLGSPDKAH